jgi:hypothetical protein
MELGPILICGTAIDELPKKKYTTLPLRGQLMIVTTELQNE